MARHSKKTREKAREFYLTGEVTSISEIARRLSIKAHTVGKWKREEDWDAMRLKIDKRAAEQLVERIATERVNLNSQHFKLWGVVVTKLFEGLQKAGLRSDDVRALEKVSTILERAQKGQRLARGLSLDGEAEEQIRAEAEAENRAMVDLVLDSIKAEVKDEDIRDRIARAVLARVPSDLEPPVDRRERPGYSEPSRPAMEFAETARRG
jgi:hypothetical protein